MKDLVCMRQLARCCYCKCDLTDAFQVDHMDENRLNDKWDNLAGCCGTCHANKTMHRRKCRNVELECMLAAAREHKRHFDETWAELDDHWKNLPAWLQGRLDPYDAILHSAACRSPPVSKFEKFRWKEQPTSSP